MILEQIKAEAKESLSTIDTFNGSKVRAILEHNYEELIDSTHQATVEEIIKIAEDIQGTVFGNDIISRTELIKAIQPQTNPSKEE
jgi:regulator of extracellular matrix RemA (YlzA/DUF370 family)